MTPKELAAAITRLSKRENADLYIYSAEMRYQHVDKFRVLVRNKTQKRKNAILFLTTLGGDPDAAFRLAASLKRNYTGVTVYIFGDCKSAGTLVTLGATGVVLGDCGELGPLDVQLAKQDEILPISSGLDIFQALAVVTNSAFESFERFFLTIVTSSAGSISAKTSAEIARELAVGIFSPMTSQIDPERLGEVQRAINIATAYGKLLDRGNLFPDALEKLVQGYPSHSFVIDIDEAKTIFRKVRAADKLEASIGAAIPGVRRLINTPVIIDVEKSIVQAASQGHKHAQTKTKQTGKPKGRAAANTDAQPQPDSSGNADAPDEHNQRVRQFPASAKRRPR